MYYDSVANVIGKADKFVYSLTLYMLFYILLLIFIRPFLYGQACRLLLGAFMEQFS